VTFRNQHITLFLSAIFGWLVLNISGSLLAQTRENQGSSQFRSDSLKASALRGKELEMSEKKAKELLRQALDFEEKQELRNALRCLFQALNYYEKVNDQLKQVEILLEIGRLYERWEVPERAIDYFQRTLIKIKSHSLSTVNIADIHVKLGESYLGLEKYDLAEKNFQEAIATNPNPEDKAFIRRVLSMLSDVYMSQRKLNLVLKTNLEIIEIERKTGPSPSLSLALNNVGFIYKSLGDYDKSLIYINQAIENETLLKTRDVKGILSMRINMASALNQQKRFSNALSELFRALKLAELERDLSQQAEIRNYIALIYFNIQDFQNAHYHCEEAVRISKRSGDPEIQVKTYKTFGLILEKLGSFKDAYDYIEKCNALKDTIYQESQKKIQDKLLKRINIERTEKELKILLTDAEKSEFELQKLSLEADRKQKDLELITKEKELQEISYKTQSLENEKVLQLSLLQAQQLKSEKMMQDMALQQFESAISGQRLAQKNRETRILLLEQEKKILEKNRKLQESKLHAQSTRERYFKAIGILIALVLVSVVYGFIQIRQKNQTLSRKQKEIEKANASLEELNLDIYTKNKSITDSIKYARGIQEAILPEKEKWFGVFPQSFIFYQPKDIVSGDFYFLSQYQKKWFLAFADCTGHGVPGALMSMIGHNQLTSIIEVHGITDPTLVLKALDSGIRKTLKTQNTESRDSMELGLCIFDFENGNFEFASSMRPLYGIRNGEFFEWKGDRHPLGVDSGIDRNFTLHTCPIRELDAVYLCSDGYQDQLGGPEQKRFLSNRLKALLQGISGKPMNVQGKVLEFTMKDWMKESRQLDDMLVIGIRPNATPAI
jgi:serine phosphatase RsbU (regulator of sigma subunit)/tetratricopeptide (TPR) repeat protein